MVHRNFLVLAIVAALAAACASKHGSGSPAAAPVGATASGAAPVGATGSGAAPVAAGSASAPAGLGVLATEQRKLIRTGKLSLGVGDFETARAKIDAIVTQAGGYVDATAVLRDGDGAAGATIVVRVPALGFDAALPRLRQVGRVVAESTQTEDITDQYVDTTARLDNAQVLAKRLRELAADRTARMEDLLAVERELARVEGEIEQLEGRMRQWNDQIDLSTITIDLMIDRPAPPVAAPATPSLGDRAGESWHGSLAALRAFGAALAMIAVALLPWLVVFAPAIVIGRRIVRRVRTPRATTRAAGRSD